jgi:cell division protein FtsL
MARYENTARNYMAEPVRRQQEEGTRRDFEVVEGRGLDARVRQGVSYEFLRKIKMVLMVAAVVIVIGLVRVGLSAATVTSLQRCSTLRSDIEEAQSLEDELRAEKSVLSSSSRIEKIATQNYGMTLATDSVTITLDDAEDTASDVAGDAAATEETSGDQSASDDASDGDVGQTASETGSATAEA